MRKSYGAFKSVDDLKAICALGPKRLEKMRKYLTVGKSAPAALEDRDQVGRGHAEVGELRRLFEATWQLESSIQAKQTATSLQSTAPTKPAESAPSDSNDEEPGFRSSTSRNEKSRQKPRILTALPAAVRAHRNVRQRVW